MTLQAKIYLVRDILDELAGVNMFDNKGLTENLQERETAVKMVREILKGFTYPITRPRPYDVTMERLKIYFENITDSKALLNASQILGEQALTELHSDFFILNCND